MFDLGDTDAVLREYDVLQLTGAVAELGGAKPKAPALPAPEAWDEWLGTLFPRYVTYGFADHHADFWEHVWAMDVQGIPRPVVAIWARGGAKSTSAELATVALGLHGARRYALYVCSTQEAADKHVATVASLLESDTVGSYYPEHADRALSKFGHSRGWRRNRLVTNAGFVVDAAGLDTAIRGIKFEEQRPDLIILDDLDEEHDTPATTAKKIRTLTKTILPAGASNVAVIAIQNLIIPDGIFTRLSDGRADYLAERRVLGPTPAVRGLKYEYQEAEGGTRRAVITSGEPTWEGQDLGACQALMDRIGLAAFLKECQHAVTEHREGLALKYTDEHLEDLTFDEARELVGLGRCFGGMDFGAWRFGFVLRAVDRDGVVHQITELFSQRETLTVRAQRIDDLLRDHYEVPPTLHIWGDAANPQDILEINTAFRRVAEAKTGRRDEEWAGGPLPPPLRPYFVTAVKAENKMRSASVDRLNDLLDRKVLRYRRGTMEEAARLLGDPGLAFWMLNRSASSAGVEMSGSRLLWEVKHWEYPIPKDGEAQDQDPSDDSADGADLIAADRYALMSWWKQADPEPAPELPRQDYDQGYTAVVERLQARTKTRRGF